MDKNSVFVLKQPTHGIVSIVLVNRDEFPVNEAVHENLDALAKISDLLFIFKEKYNIFPNKFSNLYGACGFINNTDEPLGVPFFILLSYCREVFNKHSEFIITDTNYLSENNYSDLINRIPEDIALGGSNLPITEIRRLNNVELAEIYEAKKAWIGTGKFINDRVWSTHKTTSPIIYLKKPVISAMLGEDPEDKEIQDYIKTFSEGDLTYLLGSYIKKLSLDNLNFGLDEYFEKIDKEKKKGL
jgi:hypothetical protein